jgi:hypothetical protein
MAETAAGTARATPASSPAATTRAGPGSGAWIGARNVGSGAGFLVRFRFRGVSRTTGEAGVCTETTGAGAELDGGDGLGAGAGSGSGVGGVCASASGAANPRIRKQASRARPLAPRPWSSPFNSSPNPSIPPQTSSFDYLRLSAKSNSKPLVLHHQGGTERTKEYRGRGGAKLAKLLAEKNRPRGSTDRRDLEHGSRDRQPHAVYSAVAGRRLGKARERARRRVDIDADRRPLALDLNPLLAEPLGSGPRELERVDLRQNGVVPSELDPGNEAELVQELAHLAGGSLDHLDVPGRSSL